jgi:hypothetical protein
LWIGGDGESLASSLVDGLVEPYPSEKSWSIMDFLKFINMGT